jgi:flagellar protein FliS
MTAIGYEAYSHAVVHTTDNKERILLMLYDGAVRFVRFARMGIEEKSPKVRGENISKVLGILTELDCALDREGGGELVENLADLYRYMMDRLTHANVKNNTGALDEVERLLTELKEGFEGALQEVIEEVPVQPEAEKPGMKNGETRHAVHTP